MISFITIVFSVAIISLVTTQSIVLSAYVFIGLLILSYIRGLYTKKTSQYIVASILTISMAFLCVQIFLSRYNHNIARPAQLLVYVDKAGYQTMIATGTIIEKQTYNRYLWESENRVPFFLYTENKYAPGDIIRLTARGQLTTSGTLSLFTDHEAKKENIKKLRQAYAFDFTRRQIMKGVAGSLYEQNSIILGKSHINAIAAIKNAIQTKVDTAFEDSRAKGLVAGMLIGDRSWISPDDYELFIDSGIVHIVAVSGGNIIMLVLFLQLILFWTPFYIRICIIIPCVIFYALICGLDASVLRATIMASLSLLALFRGKQTVIRRSLLIAYISMLCINPLFLVYDVGFLFSFAAIIGIVYMTQWTYHVRLTQTPLGRIIARILRDYVFPSVGASIAIVPFLLFFTGKFNLFGLIANILIVPLTPFIMIGGGLASLLQIGHIGTRISWLITHCIIYTYAVASLVQQYGIYIISSGYVFMYMLLGTVILLFIVDRIYKKKTHV